jgi:hypothetical protein
MRKIKIIRLETDDAEELRKFMEMWKKLKPEVEEVFVPKGITFISKSIKSRRLNK